MILLLEKELEAELRRKVKAAGGLALKFVSPGRAGVPDRIVLAPGGKAYFVEMKRPHGKLRPLQKATAMVFKRLGHVVTVVDSEESLEAFMQRFVADKEEGDAL